MTGRARVNRVLRIERLPASLLGGPHWAKVYYGDEVVYNGAEVACKFFVEGWKAREEVAAR